jgi:hypothetical protein
MRDDGTSWWVDEISVVQFKGHRTMTVRYEGGGTYKFVNPNIEDMGTNEFHVSSDKPYASVLIVRWNAPLALLCSGCEVCRS